MKQLHTSLVKKALVKKAPVQGTPRACHGIKSLHLLFIYLLTPLGAKLLIQTIHIFIDPFNPKTFNVLNSHRFRDK